jgi:LacI family transcriptional regulator
VSRVINDVDRHKVSEETRARVLEIARSLRYRPNPQAVSLVRRKPPDTLGLFVPYNSHVFDSFYFTEIIRGAVDASNARGMNITLFIPGRDATQRERPEEVMRRSGVAGLILIGTSINDPVTAGLRDGRLPFVVASNSATTPDVTTVDCDNVTGALEATRHLIRLGRRRIAFIAGPDTSSNAKDRLTGYRLALEEAGIPFDPALVASGGFEEPGGREAMRALLGRVARPEAVFAANDVMAIGAMKVCKRAGLRIPQDIAFVGFDDVPLAEHVEPALTTVHQPIYQIGRRAAETLIGRVLDNSDDDLTAATHLVLRTRLVVRESCGARRPRPA